MPTDTSQYDFFIAHAGPDSSTAEALYDLRSGAAKVFLDSRSLEIACDWDLELSKAQRQSFITVVLVSSRTDAAYYERVEVASAIRLARAQPERYRVVPVALDDMPEPQVDPYGLNLKHGLSLFPCRRPEASKTLRSVYWKLSTVPNTEHSSLIRATAALLTISAGAEVPFIREKEGSHVKSHPLARGRCRSIPSVC